MFERTGNHRNAAYACIGRLRAELGTRSYEEIARDLERELQTPVVDGDPRLKLLGFAAKGYRDIEINAPTAKQDWEQVLTLARQLSDKKWTSRAEQCVRDGLAASAQIGDRYYLPRDLNALAELEAIEGRAREAETSYRRAEAIVEGMLSRAPGRYAEASLLTKHPAFVIVRDPSVARYCSWS